MWLRVGEQVRETVGVLPQLHEEKPTNKNGVGQVMVYKCLCCGKELTEEDVSVNLYERDQWGQKRFRGKVDYTCYTTP